MKQILRNRLAASGAGLILILITVALLAPILSPGDPLKTDLRHRLRPPCPQYPLGTDNLGRCVLSRTLCGARTSLAAALAASGFALILGMGAGLAAGLSPPAAEAFFMRMTDIFLAFPGLMLALVITGITGPSLSGTLLGVGLAGWAWWARFIRGLVRTAKAREFVEGGRVIGVRGFRLVRCYILPQILPETLVAFSLSTGGMIVAISGLSYLGLGAQPPAPEWGMMLREARIYMVRAPWLMAAPGVAVTLSVLAFNLLGEGLRDLLQVRETTGW